MLSAQPSPQPDASSHSHFQCDDNGVADGSFAFSDPLALRLACRAGKWSSHTSGQCPGFRQANIVILPAAFAPAFRRFCDLNWQACPILFQSSPGDVSAGSLLAPGGPSSDIRTDLPRYRIYRHGTLAHDAATSVVDVWRDDLVTFYLGCSFSFELALLSAGVPVRNIEQRKNVSMYITDRDCIPSDPPFGRSKLVVSYRPVPAAMVDLACRVTASCPASHGAPVHIGDPVLLGIRALESPEFGEVICKQEGDVDLFWACGVTAVLAATGPAEIPLVITHNPGSMFVSDVPEASK